MRKLLIAVVMVAAVVAVATIWLLRDPAPYWRSRHTPIAEVRTEPRGDDGTHQDEVVTVRATSGLWTQMLVRRPLAADSAGEKRALFIILGGYETGERAATLIPDTRGNVVAALAYPYDGDLRVKGLAVVPVVPALRRAILDTPPSVMLALDYLLSRPDVDSSRVELIGASFGTPFAAVVGALDSRVTRVWSLHGAAMPYTLIAHNLRQRIPWTPARTVVAGAANVLASGPRLAPERWVGQIAPRPFVMINASEDERMPREAILALYNSAREPRELVWLPGEHVQSNRRQVLESLVSTVLERSAPSAARSPE